MQFEICYLKSAIWYQRKVLNLFLWAIPYCFSVFICIYAKFMTFIFMPSKYDRVIEVLEWWVIVFFAFFWICTYTWEYKLRDRLQVSRSSHPEVFLGKGVLKICNKFSAEHPYRSAISIKLLGNFIEITLWHGRSLVNLLHIFRTPFPKNTSGWLLLKFPFLY